MNDSYLLTDFQQCTADRIFEVFHNGQRRVLLADEVGLGKTIVAREVIKRISKWHRDELHDDHFKVVYICSNMSIARQNAQKLGIRDQLNVSESRLSMQHLKIYEGAGAKHDYEQLIPLTPATSFSATKGCGTLSERALMFAHLWRLPVFDGYKEKLYAFMAYDPQNYKSWPEKVNDYERAVQNCAQNGSRYLEEMAEALKCKFAAQPNLACSIKANCDSLDTDRQSKSRPLINKLRKTFAEISLSKMEADLVIMDEFQRFRDLLDPPENTEDKLLSQQFLQNSNFKVLLLSATPYKPYSTLEEIAEDECSDHFHEFMSVMNFLYGDEDNKRKGFEKAWADYSSSLCEINAESLTVLITKKDRAQEALYQGVCRTERFNTGIIDHSAVRTVGDEFSAGDILSYDAMQKLVDAIKSINPRALHTGSIPVDYIKSAPYLLSFMENNYQIKKQIREFCLVHQEFSLKDYLNEKYLFLSKASIHQYRQISANNARLEVLKRTMFSGGKTIGSEALLWVPPSRPYYRTGGVFDRNRDFSKVLVFSSWEMVPRMISTMLSYEAERLTIGKLFNSAKTHRGRGYFATKEERRFGIGRLKREFEEIICLVSVTLAELYKPEKWLGSDLNTLRSRLQKELDPRLIELRRNWNLTESSQAGANDLIECIKALDGDPTAHPTEIPPYAGECMVEMAIGSPAICAYRMLMRSSRNPTKQYADFAKEIAKSVFVSMFNKAESSAILDLLYDQEKDEDAYYRDVFRYCAEGNLQAVLDEFAHVLNTSGEDLKTAVIDSIADTVTLPIDTQESFPAKKKTMMRCHYAVGYFNARVDDDTVARVDRMRKAFNSPFRPFVLATTSIGQEGLDFHLYCRKVMHWNLPSNPIDLEQREGRVNRFKCLAVRQNVARRYGNEQDWDTMFSRAASDLKGNYPDLVPYWCLPNLDGDSIKIERIVPMYPFSQDQRQYDRIIKILSLYRLTLGQPLQEELISLLDQKLPKEDYNKLFMNLSPFYRREEKPKEAK